MVLSPTTLEERDFRAFLSEPRCNLAYATYAVQRDNLMIPLSKQHRDVTYSYILALLSPKHRMRVPRGMNPRLRKIQMGFDVNFAKGRFPLQADVIDMLARRSESFRELCNDFATAEQLRQAWQAGPKPGDVQRLAELEELVDSLRAEIAEAINNASVVPFRRQDHARLNHEH